MGLRLVLNFIIASPQFPGGLKMREELKRMLKVDILEIEYEGDKLIVYVPKDQVKIAVGSGGSAVRAAELVLGKKIEIRGR